MAEAAQEAQPEVEDSSAKKKKDHISMAIMTIVFILLLWFIFR
jgi:hypothetical protein